MKNVSLFIVVVVLFATLALGQTQPKATAPVRAPAAASAPDPKLPPGVTLSDPAFLFPAEEKIKIRDLQFEYDELEIDSQKMLVKVEQNKARQAALLDAIKMAAYQFAQKKNLSLDLYDLDAKEVKFTKRKAK